MVALILCAAALASPVVVPEPELRELDHSKIRRVPSFTGIASSSPRPAWLTDAYTITPSPDGKHITADDYERLIYGTVDGERLWTVRVSDGADVRFVGDYMLTSQGYDGGWVVRDSADGRVLSKHDGYLPEAATISADGKLLAFEGEGAVQIMGLDGREIGSWATDSYMGGLQFSADGRRLLLCDNDVRLWDLDKDRIVFFEKGKHWTGCTADPDLKNAYVGRSDGFIEKVPLEWDKPRTAWDFGHPVYNIAWVAPDTVFVAGDAPFTAVVDLGADRVTAHLEGQSNEILVSDGRLVAMGERAVSWTWPDLTPTQKGPRMQYPSAVATDGDVIAVGDDSGAVHIYRGGKLVQHLWGFASEITDLDFFGERLAIGDWSGSAWIVDWKSAKILKEIEIIEGSVFVQWSPDGEVLIASVAEEDDPSWMEIWDAKTWTRLHKSGREDLASFAFASHGEWFVAAGDNSSDLQVIHTRTGEVLRSVPVAYRQDWTHVAVIDDQQAVALSVGEDDNYLWRPPEKPEKIEAWGWSVAFTEDGRKVAVDGDGELAVFDSITGRELFVQPLEDIYGLVWSGDGRTLHSVHGGGQLRTWTVFKSGSGPDRDDLADLSVADLSKVSSWRKKLEQRVGRAESMSVATDGRIAVAPVGNKVQILLPNGEKDTAFAEAWDYGDTIEHVWFAPDGALLTSDGNRVTKVWRDGEAVDTKERCQGGTLADGKIQCVDPYNRPDAWRGAITIDGRPLPSQPGQPTLWAMSPDASQVVVAARTLAVVWDVKSRRPVGLLKGPATDAVAWSADGSAVITLGDGKLTWWAK